MRNNHQDAHVEVDTSRACVVICPGFHGHGAARSLGRWGVDVYGIHSDLQSPTASSKYWRENFVWNVSTADNEQSVEWFLELGKRFDAKPILIASDDHSSLWLDDNAEALSESFLFHCQPPGLTLSLSNKKLLYDLCKKNGILTAETVFPQDRRDVEAYVRDCTFPVMVKGIDTVEVQKRTGLRMVIANDTDALFQAYDQLENPERPALMLQKFVPGKLGNSWMFDGYFNGTSDCLFGITARKIRQYPAYTGMTSLGICEDNPELREIIVHFMKALGYRGILDIGFKYNPIDGRYYLLDPNPRLGASFRLFVDENEMDVVRAMYLDLTGQEVKPGKVLEGRKWLAEPFDAVSSMQYLRDGNLDVVTWARSFSGVREAQWFDVKDMGPFWRMCSLSLRSLWKEKGEKF